MAIEWYMMQSPTHLSGFESEDFDNLAQEAFLESLESSAGCDVELCNYDLSECVPMRAIVESKLQDTKLQSTYRQILFPIGTCHAGMYVKYKERYWLIVGLEDDNGVYEKVVMWLCNYKFQWISTVTGKLVERWGYINSASQYNNGETPNANLFRYRSDQLMVFIPDDEESLLLDNHVRFIIDRRCEVYKKKISDHTNVDTSFQLATYGITRTDSTLYDYQIGGHMGFLATQDEQHEDDGFYRIDGKECWVCDGSRAFEYLNKTRLLSSEIIYDEPIIYDDVEPTIFTAAFYDEDGNLDTFTKPQWGFFCDFKDDLCVEYVDNSILISTSNSELINKSFELLLDGGEYETQMLTVTIKQFL